MSDWTAGWLPVPRTMFDSPWWNEKRARTRFEALLDLRRLATYQDTRRLTDRGAVEQCRGEVIAAHSMLAERWRWSEKKVRIALELFQKWGEIRAVRRAPIGTVYAIVGYDFALETAATGAPTRAPKGAGGGRAEGQMEGGRRRSSKKEKKVKKAEGDAASPPARLERAAPLALPTTAGNGSAPPEERATPGEVWQNMKAQLPKRIP